MTIRLQNQYPGQVTTSDPNMPYGKFKNVVSDGDNSGTPLEEVWPSDVYGAILAILASAGITPNNLADNVNVSQLLDALNIRIGTTGNLEALAYEAMFGAPTPHRLDSTSPVATASSATMSDGGDIMHVLDTGNERLYQFTIVGSKYILDDAQYLGTSLDVSSLATPKTHSFGDEGGRVYVLDDTGPTQEINQWTLGTPWSVAIQTPAGSFSLPAGFTSVADFALSPDGAQLYVLGRVGTQRVINRYALGTDWDITTAGTEVLVGDITTQVPDAQFGGIQVSSDGKRLFVNDDDGELFEFRIEPAFVGTATYFGRKRSLLTLNEDGQFWRASRFVNNGARLLVVEANNVHSILSSVVRVQ